ncbi:hypothetical protein [Nocardia sputi]|uniref:hypothetical protein n=1 Tax=Nocardia sputi TaxID=2943705 RepID=UPI0020C06DE3|nr:hypothetical protein [Nocardia sputi]
MSQATRHSRRRIAADAAAAAITKAGIGLLDRQFATKAGAASPSEFGRGPKVRGAVNLIGRLLRDSSAVVLFLAVLLVAPMIDCGLLEAGAHAHASVSPAESVSQAAVHGHDLDDAALSDADDYCGPHIAHCIIKSLLPGTASTVLPLQLLGLMLLAALAVLVSVLSLPRGGVRAPPDRSLPGTGRDILTRLCIARR